MTRILWSIAILFSYSATAPAQEPDFENFRVEVTGMAWLLRPGGTVTTRQFSVDLRSDLGITDREPQFFGKLVLKPARKHRILIEGIPYRLSADTVLSREIQIAGRTYSIQQRISSSTELNYIFGGYQYDLLSRRSGHIGILAGVGYMDATASATAVDLNISAAVSARVPYPLAGVEFRIFPIHGTNLLNINGEFRGMNFGDFGYYLQGGANAGISIGRHLTFQAGYAALDADVHDRTRAEGVKPSFRGPIFSIQLRDR